MSGSPHRRPDKRKLCSSPIIITTIIITAPISAGRLSWCHTATITTIIIITTITIIIAIEGGESSQEKDSEATLRSLSACVLDTMLQRNQCHAVNVATLVVRQSHSHPVQRDCLRMRG